ncbi:MAG: 1-deoxy-D-xylulose-5-phosphate reductoisomerase [Geminicoccaceae bacterium]|nr:1-deoxy-D-xylulose-5-phosphate reductoisomerase [Geminicoccaceae bacterium]
MTRNVQPPSVDHPRSVTILGVTGSVGRSTIEVIRESPEFYKVVALTAWGRVEELASLAIEFRAQRAVIGQLDLLPRLESLLGGTGIEAMAGEQAIVDAAELDAAFVMASIVGAAGLAPTLAAIRRGALIGLANKECLICAGPLLLAEVSRHGAKLLPVDSEHSAIFQSLEGSCSSSVETLTLTASGGPFRGWTRERMAGATLESALSHPNWSMGTKITIDSATMMNKALELIEACYLFDVDETSVEVVVHPQSIIHSLVTYKDGSTLAQLSPPDMRVPIAHALGWPSRLSVSTARLDLAALGQMTFEKPDDEAFPALRLARQALNAGGPAPILFNAANEIAVAAFVAGRIGFLDIVAIVEDVLAQADGGSLTSLEEVLAYDAAGRRHAGARVERHTSIFV